MDVRHDSRTGRVFAAASCAAIGANGVRLAGRARALACAADPDSDSDDVGDSAGDDRGGSDRLDGSSRRADLDGPAPSYVFLVTAGVELTPGARRAASRYAARHGLDVLDLVPVDLPLELLVELVRTVNPARYRHDRFARGATAGHAVLVERAVLERAGLSHLAEVADSAGLLRPVRPAGSVPTTDGPGLTPDQLVTIVRRLKKYAPTTSDLVVLPQLAAGRPVSGERLRARAAVYAGHRAPLAFLPLARAAAVLAAGAAHPALGTGAMAVAVAQPLLVGAGRFPVGARRLAGATFRRAAAWPSLGWRRVRDGERRPAVAESLAPPGPSARRDAWYQARDWYQAEIDAGVDRLLEPRRRTCPWCGSGRLRPLATTADLVLRKAGRFRYDRCLACTHVFQNPAPTPAGLGFYYRDFYDGLNIEAAEETFAISDFSYRARAKLLLDVLPPDAARPRAWLDVGAGHGHFCLAAAGLLPEAAFDAVDMGEGISEARRRGWVRHVYPGMFPDLVDQVAGRYDVISMFHYLEHTIDPLRELDAAAKALPAGGYLLVEVPHGQSPSARIFRGLWFGLCAPQHLHLVPPDSLVEALEVRGLRVERVQFGRAHMPGDALAAVFYLTQRLQPDPRHPWLPYGPTRGRRARRVAAVAATAPLYPLAALLDAALFPYLVTGRRSNVYRLIARKDGLAP